MPELVDLIDVVVVVFPVPVARVVRRVYIDGVDLVLVGVKQGFKGVEVLGIDDEMRRLVPAIADTANGRQAGVDRLPELTNDNYLGAANSPDLRGVAL